MADRKQNYRVTGLVGLPENRMVRALNETGVLDTPYKSAGKQKR